MIRQRLTEQPMKLVCRFVWATLGAGLAMGLQIFLTFRGEGLALRLTNAVPIGLTFGVLVGFTVLFAGEYPARLRGLWPLWARFILSAAFGGVLGTLTWAAYQSLFLLYLPDWNVILLAGVGLAAGFVLAALFALPAWLAVLLTAVAAYLPLYVAFQNYYAANGGSSVLFYDYPNQIYSIGIPFVVLIALGGHAQAVWGAVKTVRGHRNTAIRAPE
jgi:hypothetical protein